MTAPLKDQDIAAPASPAARIPTFTEAARFWVALGFISFGGPAGQIAILHREIVVRRGWLDERSFTGALNFCMLLPGPEALQLAIFLGWKLHGIRGGLVAGLGFILPAVLLLFGLSYAYVGYGAATWVAGPLLGLKAAVVALVAQALVRISRRSLDSPLHVTLALLSFVALQFVGVPFPLILAAAALAGLVSAQVRGTTAVSWRRAEDSGGTLRILVTGLVLWILPLVALLPLSGADSLWTRLYLFFTKAALITFGGAYAVLGYVTSQLVDQLGWVTAEQAVAGLALAETTPGPLVIVLQFMGFMAGWNQPGALSPAAAALLAGALAAWATFLPSFVFIFVGAPYVESLTRNARIAAALAAITAAVVGIIATLALLLAQVVLLPRGWTESPDWGALLVAGLAWLGLERARWPLPLVLAGAAACGLLLRLLQQ